MKIYQWVVVYFITYNYKLQDVIRFFSSVKWERNGSPVEWERNNDGALRVTRVEPSHAGAYTCVVMGPHGEMAKKELQLFVSSKYNYETVITATKSNNHIDNLILALIEQRA